MLIKPFTPAEMAAKHAARRIARPQRAAPVLANRKAVLDLGNTLFVTFQGRAYGVPPLPWREGQELWLLWQDLMKCRTLTIADSAVPYFHALSKFPDLLWRHMHPVGIRLRLLWRLGLHRNPLRKATEAELIELIPFVLSRRMTSSVGPMPTAADQLLSTS